MHAVSGVEPPSLGELHRETMQQGINACPIAKEGGSVKRGDLVLPAWRLDKVRLQISVARHGTAHGNVSGLPAGGR